LIVFPHRNDCLLLIRVAAWPEQAGS